MAQPRIKFTKSDFDQLPEDMRVELIDGEILKMAPPTVFHQELAKRMFLRLVDHVGADRVLFGPVGFHIDETSVLVPDVVAFGIDAPPDLTAGSLRQAALVVEVLSPSTAARDRTVKADLYLGAGVQELWLIDARSKAIEVRSAGGGERVVKGEEQATSSALRGFAMCPADLFA